MKSIFNFSAALLTFALGVIVTMIWFSRPAISLQEMTGDKVSRQTNVESYQTMEEEKPGSEEAKCLSAEYPLRERIIHAGVLNIGALDIPKPKYPAEAKAAKVEGEVKASVVIGETGKVVWARVENEDLFLQEAVQKVVCMAIFRPATISGNPYSVSGIITYKFVLQ